LTDNSIIPRIGGRRLFEEAGFGGGKLFLDFGFLFVGEKFE